MYLRIRPFAVPAGVVATLMSLGCIVSVDSGHGHVLRDEHRFVVSRAPELTLTTFDGPVEVRTWSRREIQVEVERRGSTRELAASIEIVKEQQGDRVRLEARRPSESRWFGIDSINRARSAKFVATVPREANVTARSGDGSITIEGVSGRLELRTGDGSIRGLDLSGDIAAHSGDGSVRLESVEGKVNVTTGDGSIVLRGKVASVRVRTGNGSITVRAEPGSAMNDDWDLETGDGTVTLYLPSSFDAELDARTGDGTIRTDREIDAQLERAVEVERGSVQVERDRDERRARDRRRRSLRTTLGAGGRLLRVRTGDGSISVRAS